MSRQVTVIGLGYVGLPLAALLAESGYQVYVLDLNRERLAAAKEGRSFFFEHGLDPLVKHAVESKKLIATDSYDEAIPDSDFIFSCVGTPDNPDGSSNLEYVFSAAKSAVKLMKPGAIYIQKSTVPVGTGDKIRQLFGKAKVSYVSNPEFLREGTAVADSLWPDRIVVGSDDRLAAEKVLGLYRAIAKNRAAIAKRAGVKPLTGQGQEVITNQNSAELIKVAANAFLALKISFANSMAKLADAAGADVNEIMDGVGSDNRIGRAFFNAGRGYGGGCFPKDVSGLIASSESYGVEQEIMRAVVDLNESMPGYIAGRAQAELGSLKNQPVAVLGLAFKAGTSDVRRSPGIKLANLLQKSGAKVTVYDPQGNREAADELNRRVTIAESIEQAVDGATATLVATDWPEFTGYDARKIARLMKGHLFVDAVNAFDKIQIQKAGLKYLGVGR